MPVHVDVEPDLLRWAVERAGWDAQTVERRAPRLAEWMARTRRPTLKQLEKFAADTHTPFGLLFLDQPPIKDVPIPDLRTLGNKTVPNPSSDMLDTIYLCQERQDWYRAYAQDNGIMAPDFLGSATIETPAHLVATKISRRLGFEVASRNMSSWTKALRLLIDRIEAIGVLVMINGVVGQNTHRKLNPEEFRGFALCDSFAPLIFVNGADTKAAQIFTLIHELAHIWLGDSALSDATLAAKDGEASELWCNQVAAEVLVPLSELRKDYLGPANEEELDRLARRYCVSTLVVLKRIFDAGLLGWDEYRVRYETEHARVMNLLETKSSGGGGDYYNTRPIRLSREFARAVIADTLEGSTSYREAYRLLGTKKHSTFEKLADRLKVA